ncbi:hypothetical protein F9C07_6021 [Aspergillus flavus]|uniref:Uncharacterized protein n=1 Tax=Aspergillus flavus (strain ATCC 200026 / FGSC A1120 / IAM 13836 / NRRL 3357 / JCM 12722 / SRRC 167) TaxID=332952 RepID=A0A7U2MY26_ASPFN|nr:hypothetical protein F9C07_6021 [Aspergillus flavus]
MYRGKVNPLKSNDNIISALWNIDLNWKVPSTIKDPKLWLGVLGIGKKEGQN